MLEFKRKLNKLNDSNIKKQLLELYKTDSNKAYTEYRIELAKKIAEENKNLFERLGDM